MRILKVKACWNETINGVEYLITEDGEIRRYNPETPNDRRPSSTIPFAKKEPKTSQMTLGDLEIW